MARKPAGIRELFTTSFPLMLACLTAYVTLFIERCFLANYSLSALNASVASSALCWGFLGGTTVMATMSEIFVAQFNGAGRKDVIGKSVWQMIWFSLATSLVFVPLGLWGAHFFYGDQPLAATYFRWIMCFGALQPLLYALTTFFVGRRRTVWVGWLALFITLLSILLYYVFIFVLDMGVKGAAIANCLTLFAQISVLFGFFLRRRNRLVFGTAFWKPDFTGFWKSCRVLVPPAVLYNVELIGWGVFYAMMTKAGHIPISVSSICQSLILLFSFVGEGLCRGASVLANNYLGESKQEYLGPIIKSVTLLLLIFLGLQVIVFAYNPSLYFGGHTELIPFEKTMVTCVLFVLGFLFLQGTQWTLANVLYAKGESLYVMLTGSVAMWGLLLLPSFALVTQTGFSVKWAWGFAILYTLTASLLYLKRFLHTKKTPFIASNFAQ